MKELIELAKDKGSKIHEYLWMCEALKSALIEALKLI